MLYTVNMNAKLNAPEDIAFSRPFNFRGSLKAGAAWMMLVYLTDILGEWLLKHHPDWPVAFKAVIALVPLVVSLLYVRGVFKWVAGMDELDRRVTTAAFLFATVAYLACAAGWSLLGRAGVWAAIDQPTHLHFDLVPFTDCTFAIAVTYVFWGIGHGILNRRYK